MIGNDIELRVTMERIARMQAQVAELRRDETNPTNYYAASSGFLAEIDRMQLEVRECLSVHPGDPSLRNAESAAGAAGGR
jgi:hypothetical protein